MLFFQVEWHPLWHQDDLLQMCKKEGILLQAYMSLGGTGNEDLLNSNKTICEIAEKLGKSTAQVFYLYS